MDPPLGSKGINFQHAHNAIFLATPVFTNAHANLSTQIAFLTHTVQTKANSIQFAHQSLCSPKISTLFKAIRRWFIKGCPNLTAKRVSKYLKVSIIIVPFGTLHPQYGPWY
jgi:hypothetical protein